MGDGLTIDPGPAAQVARSLAAAADRLADPSELLADVATRVGSDAATRAPRRTGALAGSGSAGRTTLEGRPAVELTWGVRYAAYVNFGTSRMPARPFATDALTAAAADLEKLATTWAETIMNGV